MCSIPGLGRFHGEGKGYPFQYSSLENSMDCIVHWVAKSGTWLSDFHFHLSVLETQKKKRFLTSCSWISFSEPFNINKERCWGLSAWCQSPMSSIRGNEYMEQVYSHMFLSCKMITLLSPVLKNAYFYNLDPSLWTSILRHNNDNIHISIQ